MRKATQIDQIKLALPAHLLTLVDFKVVVKLATEGVFKEYMRGVTYVIHVASPMPGPVSNNWATDEVFNKILQSQNLERDFFRPAIDSTVNLLSAAKASLSVKRVVLTSSNAPFIPVSEFGHQALSKPFLQSKFCGIPIPPHTNKFKGDNEICHYNPSIQFANPATAPILAYAASKSMALEAAEQFMETQNPSFDIVVLMPPYIFGPNRLSRTQDDFAHGSNSVLLNHLLGKRSIPLMTASIHIDDVAKAHVLSLDASVPAGRYLLASGGVKGTDWSEAVSTVEQYFPGAVGTTFVGNPEVKTVEVGIDTSKAEMAFGIEFKCFEEQVR